MQFWPRDPALTFVSTTTDRNVELEITPPWPYTTTDPEDIAIIQEILSGSLQTTPTTGLGYSTVLSFNLDG